MLDRQHPGAIRALSRPGLNRSTNVVSRRRQQSVAPQHFLVNSAMSLQPAVVDLPPADAISTSAAEVAGVDVAALKPTTQADWKTQYAEIATLAGGLAHEIRNPLSTIRLNLELLDEELAQDDGSPRDRRNRQKVQKVLQECSHLDQILNDFLLYARAHAPRREPSSLNDEVREYLDVFGTLAAESQVEVSPHLAAQLPTLQIDRRLFRQVLENLGRNALQAMPTGGRLEVMTYALPAGAALEFIDNGCGMDERTRERVFEAFFSTKPGGSGLGLPTAKRIVEAHGGTMICESTPGAGTRFRITLPAAVETSAKPTR